MGVPRPDGASTIRVYGSKFEADTAKALLAHNDIDSLVFGDPAHSVVPHLVTEPGFELMVLDPEIERALEVLGPLSPDLDELEAGYHHRRFVDRPTWIRVGTYGLILAVVVPVAWQGLQLLVKVLTAFFS